VPVCVLVELVDETGGWWALTWAVVSVFIFVPRVSQGSRVVFALTTLRAFVSVRTMYCSIETRTINYRHVGSVRVSARSDGTGEVVLRKKDDPYNVEEVRIYNVKGFRDACRVLQKALAPSIVERAGLSEDAVAAGRRRRRRLQRRGEGGERRPMIAGDMLGL